MSPSAQESNAQKRTESETKTDEPAALTALRQASQNLFFPSETDAPFEPFFWRVGSGGEAPDSQAPDSQAPDSQAPDDQAPDDQALNDQASVDLNSQMNSEALRRHLLIAEDEPVKTLKLESFFRPATTEETWHNAEEKARVQQFQALVKAIENILEKVQVFRIGTTAMDVYIIGKADGGFAGLKTRIVET